MKIYRSIGVMALLGAVVLMAGCRKEKFTSDSSATLRFSTDTVFFDTIFNTVGSATRVLKVYNDRSDGLRFSVDLENGGASDYRINVDGSPGTSFDEVEIGPDDSLYIFVEVTVDPDDNQLHPFVEDQLHFNVNGNNQEVDLVAYGWDAIFYRPTEELDGLPDYTPISEEMNATVTWTNEKPIVIYGYVVVDSTQKLIIEPGTEIFFHANAGLWVYRDGNIRAEGTADEKIVFQGDRLEEAYSDVPGQWDRIWINEGSEDNVFEHCVIKNGFIGIQCETLPFDFNPGDPNSDNSVILRNTVIKNHDLACVFSRNYSVKAENVEMSNAGQYLTAISGGGSYDYDHVTMANNWGGGVRNTPALFISNQYQRGPDLYIREIDDTRFTNCIISGFARNEFELDLNNDAGEQDITFEHCFFTWEDAPQDPIEQFQGEILIGDAPGFKNTSGGDFRLTENAVVRGMGINTGLLDNDLLGNPYANPPSMGCYEYMPE